MLLMSSESASAAAIVRTGTDGCLRFDPLQREALLDAFASSSESTLALTHESSSEECHLLAIALSAYCKRVQSEIFLDAARMTQTLTAISAVLFKSDNRLVANSQCMTAPILGGAKVQGSIPWMFQGAQYPTFPSSFQRGSRSGSRTANRMKLPSNV